MIQDGSIFSDSPLSFNSYSCDNFAEIAAKVCEEFTDDRLQLGLEPLQKEEEIDNQPPGEEENEEEEEIEEEEEEEFEFSFFSAGNEIEISGADEIFANGQIRPVFPVFNQSDLFYTQESKQNSSLRKLFIQERDENDHSCSSSEAGEDELDSLPAGTYCVWKPKQITVSCSSPETCKKSRSTGSSSSSTANNTNASVSKRWRLRDFLFRSNSDGKNTFVFLTPPPPKNRKEEEEKLVTEKLEKVVVSSGGKVAGKGKLKTGEVSAHEIHYVRNRALKENDRKKSYLPYRQDLVGFFANVNGGGGLTRKLHPF